MSGVPEQVADTRVRGLLARAVVATGGYYPDAVRWLEFFESSNALRAIRVLEKQARIYRESIGDESPRNLSFYLYHGEIVFREMRDCPDEYDALLQRMGPCRHTHHSAFCRKGSRLFGCDHGCTARLGAVDCLHHERLTRGYAA